MGSRINLRLTNNKHSGLGITSTILGAISFIILVIIIIVLATTMDVENKTDLDLFLVLGFAGIASIISSFIGLIFGIIGIVQKETIKTYSIIGAISNAILLVIYMKFLVLGF
ncbi:MAG: hypothetical protein ACOCRK_03955 [bacterium]